MTGRPILASWQFRFLRWKFRHIRAKKGRFDAAALVSRKRTAVFRWRIFTKRAPVMMTLDIRNELSHPLPDLVLTFC